MRSQLIVRLTLAAALAASLGGCAAGQPADASDPSATDAVESSKTGDPLQDINASSRVVALSQEAANMWLLAGGKVVGVVEDAESIGGLPEEVEVLGSLSEVDPLQLTELKPDLVIASGSDEILPDFLDTLTLEGVPVLQVQVDSFEAYAELMEQLTQATGRDDLYESSVTAVREKVDDVIEHVQASEGDTFVALRIEGESVRAAGEGDWLLSTLGDLGLQSQSVPAEDLAASDLASADPKWIFVIYGGDGAKAEETFAALKEQQEWAELGAAVQGRVVVLPQSLFEHMPANRWGEAYAYFSQVLHGSWA